MTRTRGLVGLAGTLAAFVVALWLVDRHALIAAFAQLSMGSLLLAALFSIVTTLILGARWAILTAQPQQWYGAQGFRDALVGQVFNLITPAAVGADAYRIAVAGKYAGGRARAVAIVLLERLLGVAAFALAFLVAFAIGNKGPATPMLAAAAIVFTGLLLSILALVAAARLARPNTGLLESPRLARLREAIAPVSLLPLWRLMSAVLLTITGVATWLICLSIIARSSGLGLRVPDIVMIAVVTEFARLLPISIQGVGVREATFASLAAQAGGAAAPAFAACATVYALHLVLGALIGFTARTSMDYKGLRRT